MLKKSASDWDKIKASQVKKDDPDETDSQYSEFLLNKEEDRFYEETINVFEKLILTTQDYGTDNYISNIIKDVLKKYNF